MSNDTVSSLPEPIAVGDAVAVEELVRAYEPYLRMVVRRRLNARTRTRFDSHDVVQSVWTETLQKLQDGRPGWQFADEPRLRAFLVRLTRNRLVDFYRHHRAALTRERALSSTAARRLAAPRDDHPSEQLGAEELWLQILADSAPAHRELLRLKAEGASLGEIAERTGYHEGSVRRILYELAARLQRDDADCPPP